MKIPKTHFIALLDLKDRYTEKIEECKIQLIVVSAAIQDPSNAHQLQTLLKQETDLWEEKESWEDSMLQVRNRIMHHRRGENGKDCRRWHRERLAHLNSKQAVRSY